MPAHPAQRRADAVRAVCQSATIHPDWTPADHLSYLENDALDGDVSDLGLTVADVAEWLDYRGRLLPAWRLR
jgi:hypothetical protein